MLLKAYPTYQILLPVLDNALTLESELSSPVLYFLTELIDYFSNLTLATSMFIRCLTIMNTFTLIDVGLHEYDLPSIQDSVCMSICSTTDFDISLFIVPVGGSLPLHDHQNMAVLSKLLSGTALCTSYTPLYPHHPSPQQQQHNDYKHHGQHQSESPSPFFRRSVQTKDSNSPSWFLTPSLWNLHAFHALAPHALDSSLSSDRDASLSPAEPAVMLDILLPPYHAPERRCVFFSATSHPIWLPTASVAVKRNEDASQNTPCRSGNSIGEEVEEWPWQKWVVKQVEEPSEVLPYLVQYTGEVPEQWEERMSRN